MNGRLWWTGLLCGALFAAAGCSGSSGGDDAGVPDAGAEDAGLDAGDVCPSDLPDASAPCLALNPCGNERHVGRTCTKGGGECGEFHLTNAWLCTIDAQETDLAFCTRPCVDDSDCGSGATCQGDPSNPQSSNKGCVPTACIGGPEDGGIDAGVEGGGVSDGGEDAGSDLDAGEADAGDGGL